MDYDPATVIDGEYVIVFKQDAQDHESKSLQSSIYIFGNLILVTVAVEHHKQHVHNTAKFIGINHEIRHEFNIGTSSHFRGYSAKMDDKSAVFN